MKTIDELNEITSLSSDAYVPITIGEGETTKYNLHLLDTKITDVSNSIGDLSEQFSTSKNYYPGQFILYQDKMYKFIQIHPAGEWNPNDVEETSIFQEFQGLDEKVIFTISGLPDLEDKTIVVYVEGEPSPRNLTTNSLGQAQTMITKGLTYDIYPQPYGSYVVQNYLNIKADLNEKYINIPYLLGGQPETCTVVVNITTSGNGGSINDFTGLELTIFNQSNSVLTATIDNNGKATFNNAIKYTTYTINSTAVIPNGTNTYRKPANSTILTNFDTNTVNINYTRINQNGIFLVNGTTWEETEITQDFIDTLDSTMKSTYLYIHVCTENLTNVGCDYYVRCRDLTGERIASESTTRQWSTSNVNYSHVSTSTTDFIGKTNTYYMIYDSVNLGISSPSALLVYNQTIDINGNTLNGFIGSRGQMSIIYENTGNRNLIRSALTKLGYSNVNFNSTGTWSGSQGNAPYSWALAFRRFLERQLLQDL